MDFCGFDTSSVKSMKSAFAGCTSLNSLDLSTFNTPSLTNVEMMFTECSSLKVLDISNFNLEKIENSDLMFDETFLSYLNVYNVKDSKGVLNSQLNSMSNLVVCQDNDNRIITNSNYETQCNENTDNTLVCNSETIIPTTVLTSIPTTIQTTTIQTTIQSTIPKTIPTTITNTFTTDILSSILTMFPTTISSTTPTTISTTTPTTISTTMPTTIIKTTKTDISHIIPTPNKNQTENMPTIATNTPIVKDSNNTKVILVGFSNYKISSNKFSFYTHFASIENYLYSETVTFNVLVDNEKLEAKCTLQDRELLSNAKYLCEIPTNSTDIQQISIEPDFKFDIQDNVNIVGITPFAKMYMDNIQNIDPKYNYISDSNIYVIENATKIEYGNNNINISGTMFNSQADFTTNNFDLLIYLNLGNKTQINIQCSFGDIEEVSKNYYYTLNCNSDEILEGDLRNAIAFIDNDILVVYFNNSTASEIEINTDEPQNIFNHKYYSNNKTKKSVIILSTILPIAFLLAIVLTTIFVVRKIGKKNVEQRNEADNRTQIKLPS